MLKLNTPSRQELSIVAIIILLLTCLSLYAIDASANNIIQQTPVQPQPTQQKGLISSKTSVANSKEVLILLKKSISRKSLLSLSDQIDLQNVSKVGNSSTVIQGETSIDLSKFKTQAMDKNYIEGVLTASNSKKYKPTTSNSPLDISTAKTSNTTFASDPLFKKTWYFNNNSIPLSDSWIAGTGKGVVVAVIDTGFDVSSPELINKIWTNPNYTPWTPYPGDTNGYHFYKRSPDVSDIGGTNHGTMVSTVLLGERNNNHSSSGMSPDATLMPLAVGSEDGFLDGISIIKAAGYAVDKKADVVNMSFGLLQKGKDVFDQMLENIVKDAPNTLFVASAGNDAYKLSPQSEFHSYPAFLNTFDNFISVGAIDRSFHRSGFSNYGPGVDLYAPGSEVPTGDGKYYSGTSFSAPIVSGMAANLISMRANEGVSELSAEELKKLLVSTSSDLIAGRVLNPLASLMVSGNIRQPEIVKLKRTNSNNIIVKVRVADNYLGAPIKCNNMFFNTHNKWQGGYDFCDISREFWINPSPKTNKKTNKGPALLVKYPNGKISRLGLRQGVFLKRTGSYKEKSKSKQPATGNEDISFKLNIVIKKRFWKKGWSTSLYTVSKNGRKSLVPGSYKSIRGNQLNKPHSIVIKKSMLHRLLNKNIQKSPNFRAKHIELLVKTDYKIVKRRIPISYRLASK